MSNINIVCISGNLTRDPELRQSSSGSAILNFGVAVNDSRKNQQTGKWEDVPNFIDCTMFGNRAQGIAPYMSKGDKVMVKGKLHWSQWEDKSGSKRSKVEVWADEVELPPRSAQQNAQNFAQPVQVQPVQQVMPVQPVQPVQQVMPIQQPVQMVEQIPAQTTAYDQDIPF